MKKVLVSMLFIVSFVMISCGGDTGDTGNTGDNFPNEHDSLNWSDASSSFMTWDEAVTYCENLGGRLPTISELRTLIQNCSGTETGGECGVTDACLSDDNCGNDACSECENDESGKYSVFGDTAWFWTSSELSGDASLVWAVYFGNGLVHGYYKSDHYGSVRCAK